VRTLCTMANPQHLPGGSDQCAHFFFKLTVHSAHICFRPVLQCAHFSLGLSTSVHTFFEVFPSVCTFIFGPLDEWAHIFFPVTKMSSKCTD
jgi:hypothetical protein